MIKRNKPKPDQLTKLIISMIIILGFSILMRNAFGSFDEEYMISRDMLENYDKPIGEQISADIQDKRVDGTIEADFILENIIEQVKIRAEKKIAEEKARKEEEIRLIEEFKKVTQKVSVSSGNYSKGEIYNIIKNSSSEYGVEYKLMYCLAKAESTFNDKATNTRGNSKGIDRGLFQFNSFYKSYVGASCAFDAKCSSDQMAKEILKGNVKHWCSTDDARFVSCYGRSLPNVCNK